MCKIAFARVPNLFIALAVIFIIHPSLALSDAEDSYCAQNDFNYSRNDQVDLLKIGAHAFYAEEYTKTISICNHIILSSPDYAPAYVLKGLACGAKGELSVALKNLDRAISIDPNLASAWASKGFVLYSQNNVPGANACIQRALDIDSNFSTKWNNLVIANTEKQFEPEYHASVVPIVYGGCILFGIVIGVLIEYASAKPPVVNNYIFNNSTVYGGINNNNSESTKILSDLDFNRETSLSFDANVTTQWV